MANRKSTRKYNKPLTGKRNYFALGTPNMNNIFKGLLGSINPASILNSAAGAVGDIGGALLSNGLDSKAGGIVTGVGDALGGIPIIGGLAKGALNLIGGGINALAGSSINQANVSAANSDIARMNSTASSANTFDELSQITASTAGRVTHDKGFYGRDGLLSNKAGKLARQLEEKQRAAALR